MLRLTSCHKTFSERFLRNTHTCPYVWRIYSSSWIPMLYLKILLKNTFFFFLKMYKWWQNVVNNDLKDLKLPREVCGFFNYVKCIFFKKKKRVLTSFSFFFLYATDLDNIWRIIFTWEVIKKFRKTKLYTMKMLNQNISTLLKYFLLKWNF